MDTNVLVQFTGAHDCFGHIQRALLDGRCELAISTGILLEYEEVITRLSGTARWQQTLAFLEIIKRMHGNVIEINPAFRFRVIASDPDDNEFVDCAIAANADYIVTEDRHFDGLANAGFRPQPVTAQEFTRRCLERE